MTDQVSFTPERALTSTITAGAGAKANFYETGTSTPVTVYSDSAGTTPVSQPLVADAAGVFAQTFYTGATAVKVVVTESDDSALYTLDPAPLTPVASGSAAATSVVPFTGVVSDNVQDALEEIQGNITSSDANARTLVALAGSADTYTLTAVNTITAYAAGQTFLVRVTTTNTGASTLNVDSVGAVNLQKYDYTGSLVALEAGDLSAGDIHQVSHDGTRFVMLTSRRYEKGSLVLANTSNNPGAQSLSWLDLQLTRFNRHVAKIDNLIPTVDGATFTFQVSSNGGSTWHDTAAYAYSGQDIGGAGAATAHASSSSGTINISTAVGNASGEHGLSGELIIMNAASATLKTSVHFKGQFMDASGSNHLIHLTGHRLTAGADNAARVRISSNIASGEIRWHGEVA